VEALKLVRLESDAEGALVPKPDEDFELDTDLIILAIGQGTHTDFLEDGKVKLDRGRIVVDRATGRTSNPKFYAGGDCTNGGREVVDAVADGKRAGAAIAAAFVGKAGKKNANA
jgi:glutamate synthase (NADPH/NADH) small chain